MVRDGMGWFTRWGLISYILVDSGPLEARDPWGYGRSKLCTRQAWLMINANVETKDIQLQKSHLNIQVTWMGKT